MNLYIYGLETDFTDEQKAEVARKICKSYFSRQSKL